MLPCRSQLHGLAVLSILQLLSAQIGIAGAQGKGEVGAKGQKPPARGGRPQIVEATRNDVQVQTIEEAPSCPRKIGRGDTVMIEHKGFIEAVPDGFPDPDRWVGKQIDGNPDGEGLRIAVRSGHIIRGMDAAIDGMCEGETVSVVIPPQFAYDDPSMPFKWNQPGADQKGRPAPPGSTVRYEIKVTKVESWAPATDTAGGATASKMSSSLQLLLLMFGVFFIFAVLLMLVMRTTQKSSSTGKQKKSKEDKKKKR